jgi:NAD(P)-dependent dehydrogenase (short-subunit alcohol dehydrogenase family)
MDPSEVLMNLVIAGSTGIAGATAALALSKGHRVFTIGLDESAHFRGDLRDERAAEAAVAAAWDALGGIDALFHVAGISGRRYGDGPLHECTLDGFEATLRSNAATAFLTNRAVIRRWLGVSQRGGSIVNVGSVLADSPEPAYFSTYAYSASKGAIVSMTRAAAAYYAHLGIRLNVIAPGLVRTPMSERAQNNPEIMAFVERKQPLAQGILDSADIAAAALFLLGEESRHITGQVLTVDAGWSLT